MECCFNLCYDRIKGGFSRMEKKRIFNNWISVNLALLLSGTVLFSVWFIQQKGWIPELPCLFHKLLHLYCPGCGGTRATFALLHGQIQTSFLANPAVLLGVILIIYYEGSTAYYLFRQSASYYWKTRIAYGYCILVLFLTLIRNLLLIVFQIDWLGDFLTG